MNKNNIIANTLLSLLIVVGTPGVAQTEPNLPIKYVAVVMDGPSERADVIRKLFVDEIRTVNRGEFEIRAPDDLQLKADWSLTGVRRALDRVIADKRTDIVVTLGVLASHAAARRSNLPRPVVATFIVERKAEYIPYKDGASGKSNFSSGGSTSGLCGQCAGTAGVGTGVKFAVDTGAGGAGSHHRTD